MKQKILASLTLLTLLSVALPTMAEEVETELRVNARPDNVRVDMRQRAEEKRASSTEMREARRASSTVRKIEIKQNIAKRQIERASKVFTAAIVRLEGILVRVESRVSKIQAEGGVTTESEGYLTDAKVYLSEARVLLTAFQSIEVTADNFETVREAGADVKAELKQAHSSLVKAIRTLKANRNDVETSTVETSN